MEALTTATDQVSQAWAIYPEEGHSLVPGQWVIIYKPQRQTLEAKGEGPYQIFSALKVKGKSKWVHASHCKLTPHSVQTTHQSHHTLAPHLTQHTLRWTHVLREWLAARPALHSMTRKFTLLIIVFKHMMDRFTVPLAADENLEFHQTWENLVHPHMPQSVLRDTAEGTQRSRLFICELGSIFHPVPLHHSALA